MNIVASKLRYRNALLTSVLCMLWWQCLEIYITPFVKVWQMCRACKWSFHVEIKAISMKYHHFFWLLITGTKITRMHASHSLQLCGSIYSDMPWMGLIEISGHKIKRKIYDSPQKLCYIWTQNVYFLWRFSRCTVGMKYVLSPRKRHICSWQIGIYVYHRFQLAKFFLSASFLSTR